MSVHFVYGMPGDGKSLYGMRLLVGELTTGTRPIITNLAVRVPDLNAYLQAKFPEKQINLFDRLRVLDREETWAFFLRRLKTVEGVTTNNDIPAVNKVEEQNGKRPDYGLVQDSGVFYIIDEIHEFFNARAWAETGRSCLHYLSQHRKLGDDVLCITQAVGNVDKQFRSVAQDYTRITNLSKKKVSWFRLPPIFMRRVYANPPTGVNDVCMESGTFTLDVSGLAACYDTAKGIGLHGKLADTKQKKSGLPWWTIPAGLAVLFSGAVLLPRYLTHKVIDDGFAQQHQAPALHPVTNQQTVLPTAEIIAAQQRSVQTVATVASPPVQKVEPVFCVGWQALPGNVQFMLSDGTELNSQNGDVIRWTEKFIVTKNHEVIKVATEKDLRKESPTLRKN